MADVRDIFDHGAPEHVRRVKQLWLEIENHVFRAEDDFDSLTLREQWGVGRGLEPDLSDAYLPFDPPPQQHIGRPKKCGDELVARPVVDFKGRADLFDLPMI